MSERVVATEEPGAPVVLAILDQVVVAGVSFATTAALARSAPVAELGAFALARSALLAFGWLQGALFTVPLSIVGASLPEDAWRRFSSTLGVLLGAFCLVATGISGVSLFAISTSGSSGALGVAVIAAMPGAIALEFLRRCLLARRFASAALAVDVLHAGCQLVSLWLLTARGPLDATGVLWSQALCAATACVPALLLLKWQAPGPDWRDAVRSAWSVARPSVVNAVASLATVQGSQWVIAVAGGAAPVGVQELCRLAIAPLALLAQGAMNALVPYASRLAVRAGPDGLARFYVSAGRAWWAAALAAGAVVGLAPELWLRLFVGDVPAGGPALVRLWVASTVAATLALWPALLLSALKRQDVLAHTSIAVGAVTLATTALFAWRVGPERAIAGHLAGAVLSLAVLHARVSRHIRGKRA